MGERFHELNPHLPRAYGFPMLPLLDQSHREALRRVRSGATVYLSVNPVEFHGPHLSLHNDRLVSEGLIRDLHARLEPEQPLLVGADLEVGVDPCPGPGSRHTPFTVVRRLVLDACRGLAELGAAFTAHGVKVVSTGNTAAQLREAGCDVT